MKNLILSLINYASLPLINMLILPKVTKSIEPVLYGEYSLFNNILSIVLIFSFLGILPIIIQRYLNKYFSNYEEISKIIIYLNYITIIIYIFITIIIFFIFKNKLLIFMSLNIMLSNIIQEITSFYIINGELDKHNKIKFFNIIVYILSLFLFIKFKLFNIYSLFLGNLFYSILILLYFLVKIKIVELKLKKIDFKILKSILKYGIPFIFINLSGSLLNFGDRYMIKFLLKDSDYWIGIYSIQYGIYSNIFTLFLQIYYLYLTSKLYIVYEKRGINIFIEQLKKWIEMYIIFGVLIIFLILIEYPKINSILLFESYNLNIKFVVYIILGGFLFGLYRLMGEVLNMLELTNYLNITIWSGGVLNLILNYFFIPKFGIKGAAITTFISYFLLVFMMFCIILKKTKKKILTKKYFLLLLIFICLVIIIDNFIHIDLTSKSKIQIFLQGSIEGVVIFFCYLLLFRKKITKLWKQII